MLLLGQVIEPASLVPHDIYVIDLGHGLDLSEHFVLSDVGHLAQMNFDTFDSVELLVQYVLDLVNTTKTTFSQLFKELKTV